MPAECDGRLVIAERRGQLSEGELMDLERHLEACGSCRMLRVLGADFEAMDFRQPGDAERVAKLASVARTWANDQARVSRTVIRPSRRFPGHRSNWRVPTILAAAVLFGGVAAAATWLAGTRSNDSAPERVDTSMVTDAVRSEYAAQGSPGSAIAGAGQVSVESGDGAAPAVSAVAVDPGNSSVKNDPGGERRAVSEFEPPAAPDLFRRANQARRKGDSKLALKLYRTLQSQYPASPEAQLSHLALGRLLAASGATAEALSQFERALGAAGASSVWAEALYAKGRALEALAGVADERRTWQRLLREYPSSPYANHARRRLQVLNELDAKAATVRSRQP